MTTSQTAARPARVRMRLGYATVWRWHFYAGLFCIPFVLWLACTGAMYLFKPQIDAWIDRPFAHLPMHGPAAPPSAQLHAALAAVPGAMLDGYELPLAADGATQVLVGKGRELFRVYVHPQTSEVLQVLPEDSRFTRLLFNLHGELLLGNKGSMLVELAASWAIVMILTGLYLWWPRQGGGLGGLVYPRLRLQGRPWWRDLHAVVGFWVAAFTLFLLVSGLPWAKSWGSMLREVREWSAGMAIHQDWSTGSEDEAAARHAKHQARRFQHGGTHGKALGHEALEALDRLAPAASALGLAAPALLVPPDMPGGHWVARSDAQNRPLRETVELDATTGRIVSRTTFAQQPFIDRLVGYGVAIHEGQMFGWFNQALGVFTAVGLVTVSVSGLVLWWRRRPPGRLGAPPRRAGYRPSASLTLLMVALGLVLPLLGLSMLSVLALDRWVFPHLGPLARFLGLGASAV